MAKETESLRRQADQAERIGRSVSDADLAQDYLNLAKAYRSQADILKARKKAEKKPRPGEATGSREDAGPGVARPRNKPLPQS